MSKLIFFVALACTQFSCATIKSELKLNRHAVMDHTAPRVFDPDFSVTVLDRGRVTQYKLAFKDTLLYRVHTVTRYFFKKQGKIEPSKNTLESMLISIDRLKPSFWWSDLSSLNPQLSKETSKDNYERVDDIEIYLFPDFALDVENSSSELVPIVRALQDSARVSKKHLRSIIEQAKFKAYLERLDQDISLDELLKKMKLPKDVNLLDFVQAFCSDPEIYRQAAINHDKYNVDAFIESVTVKEPFYPGIPHRLKESFRDSTPVHQTEVIRTNAIMKSSIFALRTRITEECVSLTATERSKNDDSLYAAVIDTLWENLLNGEPPCERTNLNAETLKSKFSAYDQNKLDALIKSFRSISISTIFNETLIELFKPFEFVPQNTQPEHKFRLLLVSTDNRKPTKQILKPNNRYRLDFQRANTHSVFLDVVKQNNYRGFTIGIVLLVGLLSLQLGL